MPNTQLENPGAQDNEAAYNARSIMSFINADSVTLPSGTLVQIIGTGFAGTSALQVVRSTTTGNNLLVGVVVNAPGLGGTSAVPIGGVAQVATQGICQILCDATTAVGNQLIQSAATAGAAKPGTAVLNQTIGTALQAVTISSGTALVWAYISKT